MGEIPYHYQELKKLLFINDKHEINFEILRRKESISETGSSINYLFIFFFLTVNEKEEGEGFKNVRILLKKPS